MINFIKKKKSKIPKIKVFTLNNRKNQKWIKKNEHDKKIICVKKRIL